MIAIIINTIIFTIPFTLICYSIGILYRNRKVLKFKKALIELAGKASSKLIEDRKFDEITKPFTIIEQYSYNQMLYSIKPLKLEAWFTEDEIHILNGRN